MNEMLRFHDMSHPVQTMPPKVAVVLVYHREPRYVHLIDAMESVSLQSYPNCECITVNNCKAGLTLGAARNLAVADTDARYILPLQEDDMLTPDTVQVLVDSFERTLQESPTVVHVTHGCCILLQDGRVGVATGIHAPGLYLRDHLVSNPFDPDLTMNVDAAQQRLMDRLVSVVKGPTQSVVGHHFGYLLRDTPFRRDGIKVAR